MNRREFIVEIRDTLNASNEDMANAMCVQVAYFNNKLNRGSFSIEDLERLCRGTGVRIIFESDGVATVDYSEAKPFKVTRLEEAMKRKGMTRQDLADATGVTPVTISRYITGKREPKYHILKLLAKALDTTPDYIMGYDEES